MTAAQVSALKVGDRILWTGGDAEPVAGTITEKGYSAVRVQYEDGVASIVSFDDDAAARLMKRAPKASQ